MPQKSSTPEDALKAFVAEDPRARYTFDSERDAPESEICREVDSGRPSRECIKIQMHSTRMFRAMQDLGFYCALPMDPARTYIECKPIPKT